MNKLTKVNLSYFIIKNVVTVQKTFNFLSLYNYVLVFKDVTLSKNKNINIFQVIYFKPLEWKVFTELSQRSMLTSLYFLCLCTFSFLSDFFSQAPRWGLRKAEQGLLSICCFYRTNIVILQI